MAPSVFARLPRGGRHHSAGGPAGVVRPAAPWLSCPRKRSRWAVREVLEDGFLLFSVPPPPKPSDALLRRLERLEGQTERLRKMLSGAQVPFLCACA